MMFVDSEVEDESILLSELFWLHTTTKPMGGTDGMRVGRTECAMRATLVSTAGEAEPADS